MTDRIGDLSPEDITRLQRLAQAAAAFSFWAEDSVEQTPVVSLSQWRVMQLACDARHLVGTDMATGSGRVSSRIVCIDAASAQVLTDSGRTYQLVGTSGRSQDADATWRWWLDQAGAQSHRDVSEAVATELRRTADRSSS